MDQKKLLSDLTEKERNLLYLMMSEKEDIQLLVCDGLESFICIGERIIDQGNFFIGYISKDRKICNGKYLNQHFSVTGDSGCIRIFVDQRKENKTKYRVNCNGVNATLSDNSEDDDDKLLIILIESPAFIQFTLFDGQIDKKVSHIFATSAQIKGPIRSIAISILNQQFPEFMDYLKILEADFFGEKE